MGKYKILDRIKYMYAKENGFDDWKTFCLTIRHDRREQAYKDVMDRYYSFKINTTLFGIFILFIVFFIIFI